MLKISLPLPLPLPLCLLIIVFNCFRNGATVNYNPYDNNNKQHHHLLPATNTANDGYNAQQSAFNVNAVYHQQNLQGNSKYQQLYPYYYTPPYQQQQQQQHPSQPHQSTQLWSGPPIVVEDDRQEQQRQSSANIPPTFNQQHSTGSIESSNELLPFLAAHSKVLTPTVYSPQPATRTGQAYFSSNNNNNNIIYHRDFRHEIYAMPKTEHTRQDNMVSWNNQQQQQQQQRNQLLLGQQLQQSQQQQQQPQQFYSSDTTLSYNGISNDLLAAPSLRKADVPDYGEHFKRYLENNPRRIKPIY